MIEHLGYLIRRAWFNLRGGNRAFITRVEIIRVDGTSETVYERKRRIVLGRSR